MSTIVLHSKQAMFRTYYWYIHVFYWFTNTYSGTLCTMVYYLQNKHY